MLKTQPKDYERFIIDNANLIVKDSLTGQEYPFTKHTRGYYRVRLPIYSTNFSTKFTEIAVHRLVAIKFMGLDPNDRTARVIFNDGILTNFNMNNLFIGNSRAVNFDVVRNKELPKYFHKRTDNNLYLYTCPISKKILSSMNFDTLKNKVEEFNKKHDYDVPITY